jgi:hypothetical protein
MLCLMEGFAESRVRPSEPELSLEGILISNLQRWYRRVDLNITN